MPPAILRQPPACRASLRSIRCSALAASLPISGKGCDAARFISCLRRARHGVSLGRRAPGPCHLSARGLGAPSTHGAQRRGEVLLVKAAGESEYGSFEGEGGREEPGAWASLIDAILAQSLDGAGVLSSARELAEEYMSNPKYATVDERVRALVRFEATKNFAAGFLSGVGGVWTLPVAVPASMYANWLIQARIAGAIAHMRGNDLAREDVRSLVLLCLLGDGAWSLLRSAAVSFIEQTTSQAIARIPTAALVQLNQAVGMKLVVKCGQSGAIKLQRAVPIVGGVVAGAFDASACYVVGEVADRIFSSGKDAYGNIDLDGVIDVEAAAVDVSDYKDDPADPLLEAFRALEDEDRA